MPARSLVSTQGLPHRGTCSRVSRASLELSATPMACLLVLVVAATVLTGPPGILTHAAPTSPAEAFWRAALPGAPMPEAIRELLRGAAGTNALDDVRPRYRGDDPPPMNFKYNYDDGSSRLSRNEAGAPSSKVLDRFAGARNAAAASPTVFFLEEAVRVGGTLPFHSMIPRDTAEDAALASPPLRLYTVRVVRAVDGYSFMVCRRDREAGPSDDKRGAVYGCRATGPARAYVVGMVGERGETATAGVVCRTDTSRWNRVRAAFWLLDVKPGGTAAVCHAALDAQVIPVKNDDSSSLV